MLVYGEYNFTETLTHLKRMNRIFHNFYEYDTGSYNTSIADNPEDIVEKLLKKYSPLTVLNTLEFLTEFLKGRTTESILDRYYEEISDLTDMKNNPHNYLKLSSYAELREIIEEYYPDYMRNTVSFTNFRNFMFLAILVFEVPLKLHHLISIQYKRNTALSECLLSPVYLLHNNNTFAIVLNKKKNRKIIKQIVYNIKSPIVCKILLQYLANYKKINNDKFFTAASGRILTKSNISNGLMNFTTKLLEVPITIHDIRQVYKELPDYKDELNKEVFTF
jgi:hypothetical protein